MDKASKTDASNLSLINNWDFFFPNSLCISWCAAIKYLVHFLVNLKPLGYLHYCQLHGNLEDASPKITGK